MEYLIPIEEFFDAYFECRKRKRKTYNAAAFEVDYNSKLIELWREVNEYRYEIGKSICFIVTHPKLREVFAADFRDRIIHHLVMRKLEPLFETVFIEDTYSCRKGKGTLYGVQRLYEKLEDKTDGWKKDCFVGKFDMKGFFMSINKQKLCDMVLKFIDNRYFEKDKDLLKWLCSKIILHKPQYNCERQGRIGLWDKLDKSKSLFTCGDGFGLPIGNLTSQIFANFYLSSFDDKVSEIFNGYYGRYVDDFYVVAQNRKVLFQIRDKAKEYISKIQQVSKIIAEVDMLLSFSVVSGIL